MTVVASADAFALSIGEAVAGSSASAGGAAG
jgi:hypothetical protein